MKFSDSFITEVRNATSIVEIIRAHVELRKRGRNHVGLCPFHSEKTPSFNVSEERQWYHCFGCGASGDVFKFLSQIENMSFPEAVRWLAERHGIPLPKLVPVDQEVEKDKSRIYEAIQAAESFFKRALEADAEGHNARQYLLQRGLKSETIQLFNIGYAPGGGSHMMNQLEKQGFQMGLLEKAGLAKRSDAGRGYYDAFRHRIIFPIKDIRGRTIAFGGRALDEGLPKYLNSPETVIYSKGYHLFGLCFAKEAIRQQNHAILVEGYLDCIIPHQEGIRNVVASLGTSLTNGQARLLGRYTKSIVVNYDPDVAGVNATRRSLDLLLEEGFRVNVLRLPEGRDPDSYIRHAGVGAYRHLLTRCESYLEFVADEATRQADMSGNRGKVKAVNAVLPFLAKVKDRVERLEYVSRISQRLKIEDAVILAELRRAAAQRSLVLNEKNVSLLPELLHGERELLHVLLSDQDMGLALVSLIDLEYFAGLRTEALLRAICEIYQECGSVSFAQLEARFSGTPEMNLLSQVYFDKNMPSIQLKDAIKSLNALKKLQLERRKAQLQLEIERAEADKDKVKLASLDRQKMDIIRQMYALSS